MQDNFYLPININELTVVASCITSIMISAGLIFIYNTSLNRRLNNKVHHILSKCLNNRATVTAYKQYQWLHDIYLDSLNIQPLKRHIDYIHVIKIYSEFKNIFEQAAPFLDIDSKKRIKEKQLKGEQYLALLTYRHSNGLIITQNQVNEIKTLKVMFIQETQYALAKNLDSLSSYIPAL
ncbi:hypothetical protein [Shewanella surugensis]|uniref:DUF4760 domain-containing protein n=1 Tax=Shewanella surugensis TaxID=212020 RepID=A0ABT0LAP6_9GAMM|nr:hypothetical protein [Shewanella surugensis]MCL1124435.1 hypothetical protein [Shewanella surugensis]